MSDRVVPIPEEAVNLINSNYWLGGRDGGPSYHADNAIRGAKMAAPYIDRAARMDELRRMADAGLESRPWLIEERIADLEAQ